jgi:prevent-host-death family protein
MNAISAAKFKEHCFSVLNHLGPSGIVITKRGKPVAKLLPFEQSSADLIGCMRGRIKIKGNIMSTGAWRS